LRVIIVMQIIILGTRNKSSAGGDREVEDVLPIISAISSKKSNLIYTQIYVFSTSNTFVLSSRRSMLPYM